MEEIKEVATTQGTLHYYIDWDKSEGSVIMQDAKTIARYKSLLNQHPDTEKYNVFFAFSRESFSIHVDALLQGGKIKSDEEIYSYGSGLYGTKEGICGFMNYYDERDKMIAEECDPQEVYFYEYNNHECMYSWDGDLDAIKVIINLFGKDIANNIIRIRVF